MARALQSLAGMWTAIENTDGNNQSATNSSTSSQFVDPYEVEIEIISDGDNPRQLDTQGGKIGWALLWLLGVPLPLLLIAYLIWGRQAAGSRKRVHRQPGLGGAALEQWTPSEISTYDLGMSALRELTIDKGLLERLTHLEQEEDPVKAAALFQEAEEYAFDALLDGATLWMKDNRGNFRRRWRALRAKYRRTVQTD